MTIGGLGIAGNLPSAAIAPQLHDIFQYLTQARSPDRLAAGKAAAVGVDRQVAVEVEHAGLAVLPGLAALGIAIDDQSPAPSSAEVRAAIVDLKRRGIGTAALLFDSIFSSDGVWVDPPGFIAGAIAAGLTAVIGASLPAVVVLGVVAFGVFGVLLGKGGVELTDGDHVDHSGDHH